MNWKQKNLGRKKKESKALKSQKLNKKLGIVEDTMSFQVPISIEVQAITTEVRILSNQKVLN